MAETSVFSTIDQVVRWVTPLFAVIISLGVFIYRSKVKELEKLIQTEREERRKELLVEKEERKEAIKIVSELLKCYKDERKDTDKELLQGISDAMREERQWKSELEEKQSAHIHAISSKLEDLNICINRTSEKIESYINSQERICNERHKFTGTDRRGK
jgi:hypothetical protein